MGTLNSIEVRNVMATNNKLLAKLRVLDIGLDETEFLRLFDKLGESSENGEVRIDTIVDAMRSLSGVAQAHSLFEVKCLADQTRREVNEYTLNADARLERLESKLDYLCKELLSTND